MSDTSFAQIAREKAQGAVDREIAARVELQAAIDNRVAIRGEIADADAAALAFIDAYVNPAEPNPAPIAPVVAQPAPDVEPPVFTSVDDVEVAPENSSGGMSPVAEEFEVVND